MEKQLSLDAKLYERLDKQAAYSERIKASVNEVKHIKQMLEKAQASWEGVDPKNWKIIGEMVDKAGFVLDWLAYLRYFHESESMLPKRVTLKEALDASNKFETVHGGNFQMSYLSGVWERASERLRVITRMMPYGGDTIVQELQVRVNLRESINGLTDYFDRVDKRLILKRSNGLYR